MKIQAVMAGILLASCLAQPMRAEEPPDDTIVQETLAQLESDLGDFGPLPEPDGSYTPGTPLSAINISELLEAEVWVKSERLSRSGTSVYEVNRRLPGYDNWKEYLRPETRNELNTDAFEPLSSLPEYIEVVDVEVGGKTVRYGRIMPPDEVSRRKLGAGAQDLADLARVQALGSLMLGAALQDMARNSPFGALMTTAPGTTSGFVEYVAGGGENCPRDLQGVVTAEEEDLFVGDDGPASVRRVDIEPWTSINPMTFMFGQACFLLASANAIEALGTGPSEKAQELSAAISRAREALKYQGTEAVDGRPAHEVAVHDLNLRQVSGGQQVTVTSAYRWIDAEYLVPRKLRLEGTIEADGQSREFFLEKLEQDYRNVPDSSLYEPYRTVLRMGGMLSPEQQAEMRESQGKLDEFERRMASMSPAERALTTRMMGDKLEQWRSLANGGVVEFEIITTSIVINPDFSASGSTLALPEEPAPAGGTALSPEELRAAQLACLQERAAAAQEAEKKKRGFARLAGAVGRTASRLGNTSIGRAAGELFAADQTADDLITAAEELGLTEDDAVACRNP